MPGTVVKQKINNSTEKKATYLRTIQQLRQRNFSRNLPFLIVSENLPEGQVYREFADGRIELQQMLTKDGPSFHFQVVRELLSAEADKVRQAYGLR